MEQASFYYFLTEKGNKIKMSNNPEAAKRTDPKRSRDSGHEYLCYLLTT